MVNAAYHRAWRAKARLDPKWVEHQRETHRSYIQRKKVEDPEWIENRKIAKRVPNPKKPWANHIKLTPEQTRINRKKYYQSVKREVLTKYGGVCSCCGETDLNLLSIDHINNGRPEGRKRRGFNLYLTLRRMNYPSGYRVLCRNCNLALGFYGYCPHNKVSIKSLNISQRYEKKLRMEVIKEYGGKCINCGESKSEFLQIDHVNGGGCHHRKTLRNSIYRLVRNQGYPKEYQILCANCNWKKYLNGEADSEDVLSIN